MDNEGLDEILNGEPEETPAVEQPEVTEEAPATAERPRGPDGKFIPKDTGETPQEAPAAESGSPPPQPAHVPESALLGERRRRQEAEDRLRQMEAHLQQLQRPQQQEQPVDFWDDPNAVIGSRVDQAVNTALQQWEQRQLAKQLMASANAAKAKYEDFDDVFQTFVRLEQADPSLTEQAFASGDPAEFAYRKGKQFSEFSRVGDLDAIRQQAIEEYKATVLAETRTSLTAPTTTAGMRSVSGRAAPEYAGPTPIGDILK